MKHLIYICSVAALFTLASCSKNEEPDVPKLILTEAILGEWNVVNIIERKSTPPDNTKTSSATIKFLPLSGINTNLSRNSFSYEIVGEDSLILSEAVGADISKVSRFKAVINGSTMNWSRLAGTDEIDAGITKVEWNFNRP